MPSKALLAVCFASILTVSAIAPMFSAKNPSESGEPSAIGPLAPATRGFPDKDPDSGKFLGQAGNGLSTLAGQTNKLYLGIPAGRTSFTLSIFDGDGDDHWDQPQYPVDRLDYKLYKDPMKSGGSVLLDSWTDASLLDDDWSARTYATSSDAKAPSGNFFYRVEVNWHDPGSANDMAGFKLKVDGQISVAGNQAFCVQGAPMSSRDPDIGSGDPNPGDQNDPNANSYDGDWFFYFYVPVKVDTMKFKDGDLDRADDTDDANTPNTDPDGPGPAIPEGINPGAPADDGGGMGNTVPPSIMYKVTDPQNTVYANNNPSGTEEWENFIISDLASENPDYQTSKMLQPGLWKVEMRGLDAHNLACLSAPYEVFPTDEPPLPLYPPPIVEPDRTATVYVPPAQTVGFAHNVTNMGAAQVFDLTAVSAHGWTTRVYHDLNGDGNLDPGEPLVNNTGTLAQNATYRIIVQVDVPVLLADTVDVTTVRASSELEWAVQGTAHDTITVITNRPPVADARGPYIGYENVPMILDGGGSYDPDNDSLQYRWDFENDGVWDTPWAASPTIRHTWGDDWKGSIALEVSDGQLTDEATADVAVLNVLPSGTASITSSQQEGSPITFLAHVTDPGSDDLFLTWSWGDGTPNEYSTYFNNGVGPDPYPSYDIHPRDVTDVKSHAYGDNGGFEVTINIHDDDCVNCSVTLKITATPGNLPPAVNVSGGMSIDEGQSIALTATAKDPGSDDLTFTWLWGEGSSESRTYFNNGVSPDPPQSPGGTFPFTAMDSATHPYGDNGLFSLTLTVSDDDGGSVTWIGQLAVTNLAPAIQPFGPYTPSEGSAFSASASVSDPGSDDLTFEWSFELGSSVSVTHYNDGVGPDPYPSPGPVYPFAASDTEAQTYGDDGYYAITLTVTDDDGGASSYSTSATVANLPPSITPFGPFTVNEGSPFNVSATATDQGSDDLEFTWSFELGPTMQNMHYNDGANPDPAKSPWGAFPIYATDSAANTYGDNAAYVLTLTFNDDDGGSASYTTQVTVLNVPPSITPFGPFTLDEGSPTHPNATATDPGSDDLLFIWTFELGPTVQNVHYNDGTAPDPAKSPWGTFPFTATDAVSHTYGDNGVYAVSLTVKDDDGGEATYSTTVTVANLPPEIEPFGPYFVDEGQPLTASATATDQGSDDLTFSWSFELGPNPQATYFNNGVSPDPAKSPNGTFPFTATDSPSRTYGDNAVYTLTLTVTDDDGGSATYSTQVIVTNLPPSVSGFGPYQVDEGSFLSVGTSATDPGSDDLAFTWSWELGPTTQDIYYNDGTAPDPAKSPWGTFPFSANDTSSNTYGDNGEYALYLVVEDDDGGVTDYLTNVTVDNVPPTIEPFGPFEVNEGSPLTVQATALDPGSDDLTFTWVFEYGPTFQRIFYNDGSGPDPDKSPWGTFPFSVQDEVTWTYGDNGVFKVTLMVEDDDGGAAAYETFVTVRNVAPTIDEVQAYVIANITLRVAGEKWHDVCMNLVHNGNVESKACVVRYPGSPDDQSVTIVGRIELIGDFKIVLYYTPDDDPINGQPNGANPAWVIIRFPGGDEVRLHHTFNVRHPATWIWTLDDIRPYLVGQEITFNATASDVGSDDLTFSWTWDDGTPDALTTYFNDGIGPDPYPSPNGTFPFTATDVAKHTFDSARTYTITLTVNDDDDGVTTFSFDIAIGG
jgi:PKD repeat protein